MKSVWVLKLDIARFFVSIDRTLLTQLVVSKVRDPKLKHLTEILFRHDGRIGCRRRGRPEDFRTIDPAKSWFAQPEAKGLPIGNLTSQFGANFYLNALDHFILRQIKPRAYLRYMDDLVFLDTEPDNLEKIEAVVDQWLDRERGQRLNPAKTVLTPLIKGVEYLGYWLRQTDSAANPIDLFMPPKKKWELTRRFRELENHGLPWPSHAHPLAKHLPFDELNGALASINAALGYASHARSWKTRETLLRKLLRNPDLQGRLTGGRAPNASLKPLF